VTAAELRALFDSVEPLTIGLEDETMLLDPESLELAPMAAAVLERAGDASLKLELPSCQLEIVTAPAHRVGDAIVQLAAGRRALAAAARDLALPAGAGVHPFSAPLGHLNEGDRYDAIASSYGDVARAQLVCSLQIHVAVGGAERTLAVYNALRGHLPELTALAANAPFYAGRDRGFATVRPLIGGLLPRQGIPPAIPSWDAFADTLRWGRAAGAVPEPRSWWWELRPHPAFGTLELRPADAQATTREAAAVAAFAHALVAWLSERHDAGEPLDAPDDWRIAHNRWQACRHGLDAELADLATGDPVPARELLRDRLTTLAPIAARLGCADELAAAAGLNGPAHRRADGPDPRSVARGLADRYLLGA
jgi:carboxylate-amine ligase